MRRFHSGMIAHGYPKLKGFPIKGKGWTLRLVDHDPHGTYRKMRRLASKMRDSNVISPKEILVVAKTEDAARRANDLLWASLTLVQGGQFGMELSNLDGTLLEDKEAAKNPMPAGRSTMQTTGVQESCEVAAKASFRRSAVYALAKYQFCTSVCTVPLVDLDPQFATETFPKLRRPIQSVQAATALTLAYGVIEELGFEIRSSAQKPSRLEDGSWNPAVKEELEARLTKAGVDLSEPINWQIRGPRTRLETRKPRQIHQTAKPSPWAKWTIRDRMVDVVDAIAHLSWLRSHVASHRLDPSLVKLLTVYDITNGQFLAQRLLLESLGLWGTFTAPTDD